MAVGNGILDFTFTAGADLRTNIYFLVKKDTSGNNVVLAGDGDPVLGILQNKPNSGEAANVRLYGISPAVCGSGDLAEGALVGADAEGTAVVADSGDYIVGVCLQSGTDDARLATVFLKGFGKA